VVTNLLVAGDSPLSVTLKLRPGLNSFNNITGFLSVGVPLVALDFGTDCSLDFSFDALVFVSSSSNFAFLALKAARELYSTLFQKKAQLAKLCT